MADPPALPTTVPIDGVVYKILRLGTPVYKKAPTRFVGARMSVGRASKPCAVLQKGGTATPALSTSVSMLAWAAAKRVAKAIIESNDAR